MKNVIAIAILFTLWSAMPTFADDFDTCRLNSRPEPALAACTRVIEHKQLKPADLARAYYHRGTKLLKLGGENLDLAVADFTEAIQLRPDYGAAYFNRGTAYLSREDYDRAIADIDKAIEIEPPDNFSYYQNQGLAYSRKGDYDRAIADYNKAIEASLWEDPFILLNRAAAYKRNGDIERANADCRRAHELNPTLNC